MMSPRNSSRALAKDDLTLQSDPLVARDRGRTDNNRGGLRNLPNLFILLHNLFYARLNVRSRYGIDTPVS